MTTVESNELSFACFANHEVFDACSADSIARMLSKCELVELAEHTPLFKQGEKGDCLWFVVDGSLQLTRAQAENAKVTMETAPQTIEKSLVEKHQFVGEERVLGFSCYQSSAFAMSAVSLLRVPIHAIPNNAKSFDDNRATSVVHCIFPDAPSYHAVNNKHTNSKLTSRTKRLTRPSRSRGMQVIQQVLAWLLVITAPALIFYIAEQHTELFQVEGESWGSVRLLAVMVSGSLLWLFNLTRAYVACLLILFFLLALSIVPTQQTLSGFSSNAFFLALSLFGFSSVIIESGILTRLSVRIASQWANHSLIRQIVGLFSMVALNSVLTSNRLRHQSWVQQSWILYAVPASRRLSWAFIQMVIWNNVTLFTSVFLTASATNIALYGTMPEQFQASFGWQQWLASTAVVLAVMLIGTLGFLLVNHRFVRETASVLPGMRRQHAVQRQVLGRIKPLEKVLILSVFIYIVAQLTTASHKVDHRLIALIVLTTFLFGNMLKRRQINTLIDWRFLILLGAVIGLTGAMIDVGVAKVIEHSFPGIIHWINHSTLWFLTTVAITSVILNKYVVNGSIFLGMWLLPIVVSSSLNPWVLIFTLLISEHCLRLPEQLSAAQQSPKIKPFIVKWQVYFVLLRILAIALSIPYWKYIKVL